MNIHAFIICLFFCSPLFAEIDVKMFRGQEIPSHLKEMKLLCDTIHCESPYLHNGNDHGYDGYLDAFSKNKDSVVCIAYEDKKVVGMAAGMPLAAAKNTFKDPLKEHAHDPETLFFLAEFGLKPECQGKGIEEKMYAKLESVAKESGKYKMICFCEIEDFSNPTQKPPGTIIRDIFWTKSGFTRYSKLHFLLFWANINETVESPHLAVFWTKKI